MQQGAYMGIVDKIKEKYPYLTRKQRDVATGRFSEDQEGRMVTVG